MAEGKKEKKKLVTQEDIMKMLDTCYDKSLHGINKVSPPIEQFANDYLKKEQDKKKATKEMLKIRLLNAPLRGLLQVLVEQLQCL